MKKFNKNKNPKEEKQVENPEEVIEETAEKAEAAAEETSEEVKAETAETAGEAEKAEEEQPIEVLDEKKPVEEDLLKAQNDKYLRLVAEYDNFRKRSQKEKESLYSDIKSSVLSSFLPVYDNLERALKAPTEDEAYRKGVEMIMTQFCDTMKKLGITEIPSLGEKFDPKLHNAVMHVDDEQKGENEIVEVFQKGFAIGDKVIRPSMVKVAN